MGIPSIGIYSYELFKFYGVDYIMRVGSTGSLVKEVKVGSVYIAKEAWSRSDFVKEIKVKTNKGVLTPSKKRYNLAIKVCKENKIPYHTGRVLSSDVFYTDYNVEQLRRRSGGAEVTEMESSGLFAVAQKVKKQALTILTASDSLVTHDEMSAAERVTKFGDMVKIALEVAVKLLKKK